VTAQKMLIQKYKFRFSIITVTYNSAKTLETTIKSVIDQSFPYIEYIVVDGGSTDGTLDIIKKYQDKITKWVSEKDGGISDAMNKGIKMASGDIIGIIHADDWYEIGALEKVDAAFESTGTDIVCGKVRFYKNEKSELIYDSVPELLEKEMTVQHPSVFVKKSVYEREGGFDLHYKYAMDYDLLLRLKLKGNKFKTLNNVISNMRYDGKSDKNWLKTLVEARNIKITNGMPALIAWNYFAWQLVRMSVSRSLLYFGLDGLVNLYRRYFSIVKKERSAIDEAVRPVNILFISSRADVGGGPLQMFDIISNIDRDKFTPFAALPYEKPFYDKISSLGVKVIPIKKRAISIIDIIKLVEFIYSRKIHIIHSHGKGAGVYSRILKFLYPCVKVIHTFHGFHYDNMSKAKELLHKLAEIFLSRFTDSFVNVSEGEQLQYVLSRMLNLGKSVIIKNQVPLENLKRIETIVGSAKYRVLKNDGLTYFCAVARFDPVKQMPFLIESFVYATEKLALRGKIKLLLIGVGEEHQKCRESVDKMNASSFIEFLGERSDALEIMAKCDAYVSSSRREGLSLSMLEAIACGLPVLAPRVVGIVELVRHYEKGVLFENNDYRSFEAGLMSIVENHNELWYKDNVAENFAFKYKEHKEYIKKYEKLYTEIVNEK